MADIRDFPGAGKFVPDGRPGLSALAAAVQDCRGCECCAASSAAEDRLGGALGKVLVGEQPGDARQGAPFVGPAGRILDQALS